MKRFLGGFCLLVWMSWVQAIEIQHWQTDKAVPVYLISTTDLPMLDIQVLFDAGSVRDGEQAGLARLTQRLSLQAAGGLSTDALAEKLDSLGAVLSGDVDLDMTTFALRCLSQPKIATPALDLLLLALTQADFLLQDFQRKRQQMWVNLEYQQQQPDALASRVFFQQLYGAHPYAQPESGTTASIAKIQLADVKAFYQRHYVAANAKIVLVGAVDLAQAKEIAQKIVAKLPEGEKSPAIAQPVATMARVKHLEHPSSQTHVLIGQLAYDRDDPDYFPLYVANHVLGGSGLTSRLSQEIREKRGLSYSVYSYFVPLKQTGYFILGLQTAHKNLEQALSVAQQEWAKWVEKGVSADELLAAKRDLTGGFALKIDTNSKLAHYLAMMAFYDKPLNYLQTWTAKIEEVTLAQINDALKRRMHPENRLLVTVGTAKATQLINQ
jgi:zinc protease